MPRNMPMTGDHRVGCGCLGYVAKWLMCAEGGELVYDLRQAVKHIIENFQTFFRGPGDEVFRKVRLLDSNNIADCVGCGVKSRGMGRVCFDCVVQRRRCMCVPTAGHGRGRIGAGLS